MCLALNDTRQNWDARAEQYAMLVSQLLQPVLSRKCNRHSPLQFEHVTSQPEFQAGQTHANQHSTQPLTATAVH